MDHPSHPHIHCRLAEDKSAHEGSGGGFMVVRFIHLVVENHSPVFLRRVAAHYRLMKGDQCFQEDDLFAENVAPGATVRSQTFIRDSAVFDRIEWVDEISVEADQDVPREWISFKTAAAGGFRWGCLVAGALLALIGGAAYLFLGR